MTSGKRLFDALIYYNIITEMRISNHFLCTNYSRHMHAVLYHSKQTGIGGGGGGGVEKYSLLQFEPRHEKTSILDMRKQRRRSASDLRLCFRHMDSTIPLLTL